MAFVPGLLLAPAAVLTFDAQTSARGRYDPTYEVAALDLLASSGLNLSLSRAVWQADLSATTSFGYLNAFDPDNGTYNLGEALSAGYTRTFRLWSFTLSAAGQIGRNNLRLSALPSGTSPGQPDNGQPLPPTGVSGTGNGFLLDQSIWYGSTSVSASVNEDVGRRVGLSQFARATLSSSFAEDSSAYPAQIGLGGGIGGSYEIGPSDSTNSQVHFERIWSELGVAYNSVGYSQGWSHAFSGRVTGTAAAGMLYYWGQTVEAVPSSGFVPTASLGLSVDGSPISYSVSMTPVVDPRTGEFDQRIFAQVQYEKEYATFSWFVAGGGGASIANDDTRDFLLFSLTTGVQKPLTRELACSASLGTSYQIAPSVQDQYDAPIPYGFLSLIYTPLAWRL